MLVELKEIIEKRANIKGIVKEIDQFSTWWNDNCALVIIKSDEGHHLFLLVHELPFRKVEEETFCQRVIWGSGYKTISKKIENIKEKLNSERPFLIIFLNNSFLNSIFASNCFFGKERISKKKLEDIDNPDEYIRPLDIVLRKISSLTNHVGIYLGNKKVCHISDREVQSKLEKNLIRNDDEINVSDLILNFLSSSSSSGQDWKSLKARIDDWEIFLDNREEVFYHHPIIPSKHPALIIKHLRKSLENDYGKNKYDLMGNNCEHFANLIVHGINFSSQVSNYFKFTLITTPLSSFWESRIKNNLENKVDEQIFDNLISERKLTNEERQIFEKLEAKIEVSPKWNE